MSKTEIEAVSGIFGAISIACWVVVFSPQIFQNYKTKSSDGLSLNFVLIWLLGDIFNIIGSIFQHVLTSMLVLAVYYTAADVILLAQMFYYRGWTFRGSTAGKSFGKDVDKSGQLSNSSSSAELTAHNTDDKEEGETSAGSDDDDEKPDKPARAPSSRLRTLLINTSVPILIGAAGFLGWFISQKVRGHKDQPQQEGDDDLEFDTLGQVFGYLCAVTYVASRIPQLVLNWKRKATDGLSMLFFTLAIMGNATYIVSILAYEPTCDSVKCQSEEARRKYNRYVLINLSWILSSTINLVEDTGVFFQYFLYRSKTSSTGSETKA